MSETESLLKINSQVESESQVKKPSLLISWRLSLTFILFLGATTQYIQKIDMGIGIVCMLNNTALKEKSKLDLTMLRDETDNGTKCMFKPTNETKDDRDGPFAWDKETQGLILSSYFYGYILTQVLSGWLSYKFGGRIVLCTSILVGSIMTILVQPAADLGYWVLIACRFITGSFHGLLWPAISSMFIQWAPPDEKSRMIGLVASGSNLGNIVALQLGGYLCVHGFAGGWGSLFYIFGIFGIVWVIILMTFTNDSPQNHRFIGEIEKNYILKELRSVRTKSGSSRLPTPWKKIFTSKAVLAAVTSHFCVNWGNYLFLTQLPTYMKEVLKFDIKNNGLFSSLPYISAVCVAVLSSLTCDKLISSKRLSLTVVRKIFNGLGLFIPMICVIAISFITCANPYGGVALLVFGIGFFGSAQSGGYQVNINEVGGIYSGIIYGVSNTFATIPGMIAPTIVSAITKNQTQEEWRIIFYISAVIFGFGGVVSTFFTSGVAEKWTEGEESLIDD